MSIKQKMNKVYKSEKSEAELSKICKPTWYQFPLFRSSPNNLNEKRQKKT